jgi:hypothetical protein
MTLEELLILNQKEQYLKQIESAIALRKVQLKTADPEVWEAFRKNQPDRNSAGYSPEKTLALLDSLLEQAKSDDDDAPCAGDGVGCDGAACKHSFMLRTAKGKKKTSYCQYRRHRCSGKTFKTGAK